MLGHRDTKNADRLGHKDIKNVENLGHRDTENADKKLKIFENLRQRTV